MNRSTKVILLLLGAAGLSAILAWRMIPRAFDLLPSEVRGRVPEQVLSIVMTPLPTALPVPANAIAVTRDDIVVPTIVYRKPNSRTITTITRESHISDDFNNISQIESTATISQVVQYATPSASPTKTHEPLPSKVRLEGLDIIPQKFNNCGPANLSIVLDFFGHEVGQLDIANALKPNYDDRNVSPSELVDYVNRETKLRANWYSGGDLKLLKRLMANGYPVIVEKGLLLSEWQGWMGHYLTLYGYDDVSQQFDSMDTFLGPWDGSGRFVDYQSFAEYWLQFNNTFVIVFPQEKEADLQEILGFEMVEQERMWHRAALDSEWLAESDPGNPYLWFNIGTSMTHLGELTGGPEYYEIAAAAFDQAMNIGLPWRMLWYQFKPYQAYLKAGRYHDVLELTEATLSNSGGQSVEETFFYRGQALVAIGDLEEGAKAYEQALKLKPNFDLAIAGLRDIAIMQEKAPRNY